MSYLLLLAGAAGILLFVLKFYLDQSYTYRTQLNKLRNEQEALENQISKLKNEAVSLQQNVQALKTELEAAESVPLGSGPTSDAADAADSSQPFQITADPNLLQAKKPTPRPAAEPKTLTEVLLKLKFVTQEQAHKVTEYKANTKSALDEDQIYLMFEYVNPHQIQMAQAILRKKGTPG